MFGTYVAATLREEGIYIYIEGITHCGNSYPLCNCTSHIWQSMVLCGLWSVVCVHNYTACQQHNGVDSYLPLPASNRSGLLSPKEQLAHSSIKHRSMPAADQYASASLARQS